MTTPAFIIEPDDIDSCIEMYLDDERCECGDDQVFNVEADERGRAKCSHCGKVRV